MPRTIRFLSKGLILFFILPLINACSGGSLMIQKENLASVKERLDLLEQRADLHSEKINRLLDAGQSREQLLNEDIEQNRRSFESLEALITQTHKDTCRQLEKLRDSAKPKPKAQPRASSITPDKLMVGRIEKIRLTPPGRIFHARIDSGATTSSLDATDIETFERDEKEWVRFKIEDPEKDTFYTVEKPLSRHVRILQASVTEADRRPVVELQIQIGPIKVVEEFTLVDRKHLDHQVLIGRNILMDLMVVDVARKFLVTLPEARDEENGKDEDAGDGKS